MSLGEPATLLFQVAVNSEGSRWDTTGMSFTFTDESGQTSPAIFRVRDNNFPQHYSLVIDSVQEAHAGVYRVMALGERIWD